MAGPWRTASVSAASCLDANTASTAAMVRGASAPEWLARWVCPAAWSTSTDACSMSRAGRRPATIFARTIASRPSRCRRDLGRRGRAERVLVPGPRNGRGVAAVAHRQCRPGRARFAALLGRSAVAALCHRHAAPRHLPAGHRRADRARDHQRARRLRSDPADRRRDPFRLGLPAAVAGPGCGRVRRDARPGADELAAPPARIRRLAAHPLARLRELAGGPAARPWHRKRHERVVDARAHRRVRRRGPGCRAGPDHPRLRDPRRSCARRRSRCRSRAWSRWPRSPCSDRCGPTGRGGPGRRARCSWPRCGRCGQPLQRARAAPAPGRARRQPQGPVLGHAGGDDEADGAQRRRA